MRCADGWAAWKMKEVLVNIKIKREQRCTGVLPAPFALRHPAERTSRRVHTSQLCGRDVIAARTYISLWVERDGFTAPDFNCAHEDRGFLKKNAVRGVHS